MSRPVPGVICCNRTLPDEPVQAVRPGVEKAVSAGVNSAPVLAVRRRSEWDAATHADAKRHFQRLVRALRGERLHPHPVANPKEERS